MEGLAPLIVQGLSKVIERLIADSGMAVILVEQHARMALGMTREALVLDRGRVVHRSPSAQLLSEPETLAKLVSVA
jgi:branched-chain amino acid transport system ATP-binding protein